MNNYEKFKIVRPIPPDYEKDNYGIPIIKKQDFSCDWNNIKYASLSNLKSTKNKQKTVLSNFQYDSTLMRLWNNPENYISKFYLEKAELEKSIIRFEKGIYYIPTDTRFGKSNISVEQVVKKKYISNNEEVYGIYGGLTLQLNYLLSYQVPVTLEVITNNETMWNRDVMIKGRKIIVKKSRTTINKENVNAYTILELFSNINIDQYIEDKSVQREITNFIKEKEIKIKDILNLSTFFPSKSMKNLVKGGLINVFA